MVGSRPSGGWGGLLGMLESSDRAALAGLGQPHRYRRGARIVIQGDHSDTVFVVLEGRVKVTIDTTDGREIVLAVDGPGDLVGEFEAIEPDPPPRAAGAVAPEPVSCRVLTGQEFRDFLGSHPDVPLVLLRWTIRRLRAADRRRIDGTALDTPHRLALFLVDVIDRDGDPEHDRIDIDIPLAQHELGSLIGVSRNSVVRALDTLRSRRLVATARHKITVPDPDALREFSASSRPAGPPPVVVPSPGRTSRH